MKAVRLHHPSYRNCVYVVHVESEPRIPIGPCSTCKQPHFYATFHLVLNENGDVCVTPEVYERFTSMGLAPELVATKEVVPAPTVLSMSAPAYMGPVVAQTQGLVAMGAKSSMNGR